MLRPILFTIVIGACCVTGLAPAPRSVFAQDSAAKRLSDWAKAAPKRLAFTQERHLSVLSHPIVSLGVISRRNDRTIEWHQTDPIDTTVVIGPNGIKSGPDEVSDALQGAVSSIAGAVLDVFYGRYDHLASLFEIHEMAGHVVLLPLDPTLSKVIQGIQLDGAEQLNKITLIEKSGDSTVIKLMPKATRGHSK